MIAELWYYPPTNRLFEYCDNGLCLIWISENVIKWDYFSREQLKADGCVFIGNI